MAKKAETKKSVEVETKEDVKVQTQKKVNVEIKEQQPKKDTWEIK